MVQVKRGREDVPAQETRPLPELEDAGRKRKVDLVRMIAKGVPHSHGTFWLQTTDLHGSLKEITAHVGAGRIPPSLKKGNDPSLSHNGSKNTRELKKKIAKNRTKNDLTCKRKEQGLKASHQMMYSNQQDKIS